MDESLDSIIEAIGFKAEFGVLSLSMLFLLSVWLAIRVKVRGAGALAGGFGLLLTGYALAWLSASMVTDEFSPALPTPEELADYVEVTNLMLSSLAYFAKFFVVVGFARMCAFLVKGSREARELVSEEVSVGPSGAKP